MGMNNGRSNPAGQGGRIKKVWTNLRINFLKDDQTLKNWITGWRPKQFNFDTKKTKVFGYKFIFWLIVSLIILAFFIPIFYL